MSFYTDQNYGNKECIRVAYKYNLTVLLGAASQRIEYLALEFIGTPWLLEVLADWKRHERGAFPGPVECSIMFYIISKTPKEQTA